MTRYAMVGRSYIFIAVMLLVAFASQETWVLASVTGGLTAIVVDAETSIPIAGAQVSAISPSQTATSATDARGHFTFLALAPDTYTYRNLELSKGRTADQTSDGKPAPTPLL